MTYTLEQDGIYLKITPSEGKVMAVPFQGMVITVDGSAVVLTWQNYQPDMYKRNGVYPANLAIRIPYADVSSPSVSSVGDLVDQLTAWSQLAGGGGGSYDADSASTRVTALNPPQYHRTDSIHILDETDVDITTYTTYFYSPEITGDTFPDGAIQLKAQTAGANDVSFKMYMTLNSDATTPSTGSAPSADWVDVTSTFWGSATVDLGASGTAESDIAFLTGHERYVKAIFSYDVDNADNKIDIWIIKGY